jgi:hemolysin III
MYAGERFNAITHVVGTVLAVAGTAVLVAVSSGARRITALAIYGAMMIAAYLSSTLYHSIREGKAKRVFHVFDHCAIYLLIAGTYTPFTLVTLRGAWGWTIFGVIWGLAAAGIAKDIFLHGRMRVLSIALYVLMGWMIVIAFGPLRAALPATGVAWLIAGGVVYTIGIGFFAMSKRVAYTHGIWHLFVIAGSICHYVVVLRYVAR